MPGCPVEQLAWLSAEPYRYGTSDCCTRVADALLPVYGVDLMAAFRGQYSSKAGFVRAMRDEGCMTLAQALDFCLNANGMYRSDDAPRDFAIGLASLDTGNGVFEAPAFYIDGMWHGSTQDGFFAVERVNVIWQ